LPPALIHGQRVQQRAPRGTATQRNSRCAKHYGYLHYKRE
jgi:hypothetical protein